MNKSIFSQSLYSRKVSIIVSAGAMFAFALMYTALFQSFAGSIDQLTESIPEAVEAVVGDIALGATPEGWLGLELYSLLLPFTLASLTIGFGSAAIGKEEESCTLELLLASPVSRTTIFFQKALAVATLPALVAVSAWLGVALGTLVFPFEVSLVNTFWASAATWVLALVFGALSMLVQSLSRRRVVGLGVAVAALVFTYFAEIFANLISWLDNLRYISPFHYVDGQVVLLEGLDGGYLALMVLTVALMLTAAWRSFLGRDTGV